MEENLLQSGQLTGDQKEYALEMMKMENFIKEGKRIEGNRIEQNRITQNRVEEIMPAECCCCNDPSCLGEDSILSAALLDDCIENT